MTSHRGLPRIAWQKSSYSANRGSCVEIAFVPGSGALAFSAAAFGSFLRVIAQRSPE